MNLRSLLGLFLCAAVCTATAIPNDQINERAAKKSTSSNTKPASSKTTAKSSSTAKLPTSTYTPSSSLSTSTIPSAKFAQACATATAVAVTFDETVTTNFGENVYLIGSDERIGTWDTSKAIPLSASKYNNANPLWFATVSFPPGFQIQYKYFKLESDGSIVWEADPNHSLTIPTGCATTANVTDTWQFPSCANGPQTRSCWGDPKYSIDTDFDESWPTTGNTVSYTFDITNMTMAPDGFSREVLAVNGQYPGPTIYANWGDMISVTVNNNLPNNGTSIHWHGIRQLNSNTQDGVSGITECPIAPGGSKTYTFQATQYGTSWYHSHFSSQYGDGVVGPIVINGPATANYDIDLGPLPVTDWYYPTVAVHAAFTMHANGIPPEADNGLINGSMTSNSGGSYSKTSLVAGSKHRVRLINTAADNHFMVSLDGHQFTVIASDFVPIVPYNTTWLFLGIGQRYDVIINANQAPGSYWFRAEVQDQAGCGNNFNNGNIKSIFSYEGHETETPISQATSYTQRCTDEVGLQPHWNSYIPTGQVQHPTELTTSLNQTNNADGSITLHWNVNGSSLNANWETPTLEYVKTGNTNYPARANVITLPEEGQWTYWVIQSVGGVPYDVEVPHPIHLHGHDFYVLGTSQGQYSSSSTLNYNNPTRRDTAMLPGGGWLALAFQTDNPGAWVMHCHIIWHADEGLAVQFLESLSTMQNADPIGSDFDAQCAAWDNYYPQHAAYLKGDSGI